MTDLERSFTKGHGTENDFVLLPDLDGTFDLSAARARLLSDRRAGIGGDGVIRVAPTRTAAEPFVRNQAPEADWFMDYRNADGSIAEMCGNGTRVVAAYLRREGLQPQTSFGIATRAGVKHVHFEPGGLIAVNLGPWRFADGPDHDSVEVTLPGISPQRATLLDLGNPHTVVRLPAGAQIAHVDLTGAPMVDPVPPDGTNVEVVDVIATGHLRMRVHERGVGETQSCGTGAAASALAARRWTAERTGVEQDTWRVDVPGGTLRVTALPGQEVELAGPAALVADGVVHL